MQNQRQLLGIKISNAPENASFVVSFMYLKFKEETPGRLWKGGKKQGVEQITGYLRLCSLEDGCAFDGYYFWHFKSMLTSMPKTNERDLLKKPFTKEIMSCD